MLNRLLMVLALTLACCAAAKADTRVELLGKVDFNGLALNYCFGPPCPWKDVRPGEWIHVTFLVDDNGHDVSSQWPPCDPPTIIGDTVYNIRNGSFVARVADVPLGVPVETTPDNFTSPALRMVSNNCAVDQILLEGAILGRGGRCCYANGSCTYASQANCGGTWTVTGICTPTENSCTQPSGACCDFGNICTQTLQANCNGIWAIGACTPGRCPQVYGSCCSTNGSCTITLQPDCADAWVQFGACSTDVCPWPSLLPDYAMDLTLRGPINMFSSATITDNLGVYPTSILDPNHSWSVIFQNTEMFIYDRTTFRFSAASTPMGTCCPGDGHCLVTTQAICPVAASWVSGGVCGTSTCPAGSGACCRPDGTCDLMDPGSCAGIANAVYMGNGTACPAVTCPPTGACCRDGLCNVLSAASCGATGGAWMGAGTTCNVKAQHAVTLNSSTGACCRTNGLCVLVYQTACSGFGDTWLGAATCEGLPCAGTGKCCRFNGECVVVTEINCLNGQDGVWTPGEACEVPCPSAGSCCNTIAGSCSVVIPEACPPANVFTAGGTCAALCIPGAGKCCNIYDGSCYISTQQFCTAGNWTAGSTCANGCVSAGGVLPDATTNTQTQVTTPAVWTNSITLTGSNVITSLEVWLDISMSRLNDLKVSITGPNGTTLELFSRIGTKPPFCTATPIGAGYTMFGTYVFQDSATQSLYAHVQSISPGATSPGRYEASGCGGTPVLLSAPSPAGFGGIPLAGTWTLTIIDERTGINATVKSWGISINGGNPSPCTIGKCVNGASCAATTFGQCTTGTWSTGPCSPVSCTTGTPGACCFLDTCMVMCQSLCPAGAQFVGSGTSCTPASVCNVACCLGSGVCTLTTTTDCGGSAGAIGSTCTPNTCPQPRACCLTGGACIFQIASACTSGTVGAAGSTCTPNACPHPASPANDVCAAVLTSGPSVTLTGGVFTSSGATMTGATVDGVNPSCGSGTPAPDVWWRFTPANSGTYFISTCPSSVSWDTTVSVWSNCTTQVPGACGDDSCGTQATVFGHASLAQALSAGTTYLVRVGAFQPLTSGIGPFTLQVSAMGACCNTAGACSMTVQSACTGNRIFQGLYSACTPNPCPQPRACCDAGWNCFMTVPSQCAAQGSISGAEGSTCSPTSPCPIGVCCRGATCSSSVTLADCSNPGTGIGAVYAQGPLGASCNTTGNRSSPCCYADFNKTGGVTVQDIFDYLAAWFGGSPFARVGGDGTGGAPTAQSIFDFLAAWFGGPCPAYP